MTTIRGPGERCAFCRILTGREGARIVQEWDDAIAIVPLNPVTDGHVLVIPRRHVNNALEDPEVTEATFGRAAMYAAERCLSALNLITSVGAEATQTVGHLHVHVVPRHRGDGLALPWNAREVVGA